MKVLKPGEIPAQDAASPLFTGGPVSRQPLVTPEMGNNFNLGIVHFSPGARNKMHTHSSDQVLFVTAGTGIARRRRRAASERKQRPRHRRCHHSRERKCLRCAHAMQIGSEGSC